MKNYGSALFIGSALALMACPVAAKDKDKSDTAKPAAAKAWAFNKDPYPSTYQAFAGVETLITNVTIYDGEGGRIENGSVLFADGKVKWVGGAMTDANVPAAANIIDGRGK